MNPPGRDDRLEDRPDAELVERARTGDRDALETLLRRHHERIHLLCHRLCRERGDAEDATQNALLAIVRGLVGFDGTAAFSTWSHRVATNACLDELRRRGRRPVPHATADADGADRLAAAVDGRRWTTDRTDSGRSDGLDADPAELALVAEQRTALQRALADLPDEFRIPVVLRDVGELDYAEIAELLDLAPGTVRSRISRGRRKLAEALRAEDRPAGAPPIDATRPVDATRPDGNAPGNPTTTSDVREVES